MSIGTDEHFHHWKKLYWKHMSRMLVPATEPQLEFCTFRFVWGLPCPSTLSAFVLTIGFYFILFIYLFFCCCLYFFLILFYFLTLQYCIGFAIYRNESATGLHVFSILNPPPSSLPISSLWVVPVHQPQTSSIVHQTWTGDSFHIW